MKMSKYSDEVMLVGNSLSSPCGSGCSGSETGRVTTTTINNRKSIVTGFRYFYDNERGITRPVVETNIGSFVLPGADKPHHCTFVCTCGHLTGIFTQMAHHVRNCRKVVLFVEETWRAFMALKTPDVDLDTLNDEPVIGLGCKQETGTDECDEIWTSQWNPFSWKVETKAAFDHSSMLKTLLAGTTVVSALAIIAKARDVPQVVLALAPLMIGISQFELAALMPKIVMKFTPEWMSQSSLEDFRPWVPAAVSMLLSYIVAGVEGPQKFYEGRFWSTPSWRSFAVASSTMGALMKGLFPVVWEALTGCPWLSDDVLAADVELSAINDELKLMYANDILDLVPVSIAACDQILNLEQKLLDYKRQYTRRTLGDRVCAIIDDISKKLSVLVTAVNNSGKARGRYRVAPLVVRFHGQSNSGKSSITPLLAAEVMRGEIELPPGCKFLSQIYTRSSGTEYWNGYNAQPVCVYDDWGQVVDSASKPCPDFAELINAANTTPWNVPMAELENKNKAYFRSSLMILSSNAREPAIKSVNCPEAVMRRIDLDVEVFRKPLDPTKSDGFIDVTGYTFKVSPINPSVAGYSRLPPQDMDWSELVEVCRANYKMKMSKLAKQAEQVEQAFKPQSEVESSTYRTSRPMTLADAECISSIISELGFSVHPDSLQVLREVEESVEMDVLIVGTGDHRELNALLVDYDLSVKPFYSETFLSKMLRKAMEAASWLKALVEEHIDSLSLWAGVGALAALVGVFVAKFFNRVVDTICPESVDPRQPKTTTVVKGWLKPRHSAQAALDPVASESSLGWRKSVYPIYLGEHGQQTRAGFFTVVKDRLAILPTHLVNAARAYGGSFTTFYHGEMKTLKIDDLDVFVGDDDLSMLELPEYFHVHKNHVAKFLKAGDLTFTEVQVRLLQSETERIGFGKLNYRAVSYCDPVVSTRIELKNTMKYEIPTINGDCGALVTINNCAVPRKWAGFHVAGSNNQGVGRLVLQEEVECLIEKFENASVQAGYPSAVDPRFKVVRTGLKPVNQPTKSKIKNSPLHGIFPPTKGRSILRKVGGVDPLVVGVNRYAEAKDVPAEEWKPARSVVNALLQRPAEARVLTPSEAMGRWEHLEPIALEKSAGYPWIHHARNSKKINWTNDGKPNQELLAAVENIKKAAKEGKRLEHVYVDCLKDERRPLAKCDPSRPESIKTRVFAIAPFELVLATRMYVGAFLSGTIHNKTDNTLTAGVNPMSADWAILYNKLSEVGNKWFDGDWSGYDTRLPASLIYEVFDYIEEWYRTFDESYSQEDALVRRYLAREIAESRHLVGSTLYQWNGGLPSGCPGTNQIDSIANMVIFTRAMQEAGLFTNEIINGVRMAFHGDDNLISVAPELIHRFTPFDIESYGKSVGMIFTAANKTDSITEYKDPSDCQFLKRSFKPHGGFCLAPIDQEVPRDSIQWTKANDTDTLSFPLALQSAIEELVVIGEPAQEDLNTVIRAARRAGLCPTEPTLNELVLRYMTGIKLAYGTPDEA